MIRLAKPEICGYTILLSAEILYQNNICGAPTLHFGRGWEARPDNIDRILLSYDFARATLIGIVQDTPRSSAPIEGTFFCFLLHYGSFALVIIFSMFQLSNHLAWDDCAWHVCCVCGSAAQTLVCGSKQWPQGRCFACWHIRHVLKCRFECPNHQCNVIFYRVWGSPAQHIVQSPLGMPFPSYLLMCPFVLLKRAVRFWKTLAFNHFFIGGLKGIFGQL